MRMYRSPAALAMTAGMIVVVWVAAHPDDMKKDMEAELHRPDGIKWVDGPPSLPKGAKLAVLEGDPGKEGPFVFRVKLPDGYRIPPHTHPKTERITVIAGVFNIGMGEKFDEKAGRAMPAGTYGFWPPGMKHFVWATGETIIQFHGSGPWTINYLNPQDDPRRKDKASADAEPNLKAGEMLIKGAALQSKLREPGLRLIDARPQADYAAGHLPGAVWADEKAWLAQGKKEGGFRDAKAWSELIGPLGVGPDTRVVVYAANLPDAGRVWWTLKYLGVRDVALLDGGWPLWAKEGRPVEVAVPKIARVAFEPTFQADRLEELEGMKQAVKSGRVAILDARSADEFTGKDVRGKRGGRIPGSKHLEWKELVEADGRFKSPEALRTLFRARGIDPGQAAVTC